MRDRRSFELDDYVVAVAFERGGRRVAFALGDGTLALIDCSDPSSTPHTVTAHAGSCLSLAADVGDEGFLTGGDDGLFARLSSDGRCTELGRFQRNWVEQVTAHPGHDRLACAAGKQVAMYRASTGEELGRFDHPSTVADIDFAPSVPTLAAAHYNGITLHPLDPELARPSILEWDGSHILLSWAPDERCLVSSMQEGALHVVTLPDQEHQGMQGYPFKVTSVDWLPHDTHLITSGSDGVVCWPYDGEGAFTAGEPRVIGFPDAPEEGALVLVVAADPTTDRMAAGCEDGSVRIIDFKKGEPSLLLAPCDLEVTALTFSPDGKILAIGMEDGSAWLIDV
ncbi:MAG: WD40 repeat domain-containing protein [Magnetococcales bacterium]|nr:WD40 repeat domain-containing protein [Magnetococcales bacterium]